MLKTNVYIIWRKRININSKSFFFTKFEFLGTGSRPVLWLAYNNNVYEYERVDDKPSQLGTYLLSFLCKFSRVWRPLWPSPGLL